MRIVITTLIWKRPELFKIWATSICRLINSFPNINFDVLVAGSEGIESENLVRLYGFDYLETPNEPLGLKANLRLKECQKYKSDYVLFFGSDDFMNNKTFAFILEKMEKGFEEIAPMDLFIYDSISKRLVYSCGYINERKGERLAIGRAIKTDVLNRMNWSLWNISLNKSLDGNSRKQLDKQIQKPFYYYLNRNDLMIVDIKSDVNLNRFKVRENHQLIDSKKLNELEEFYLIKNL